MTTLLAAAVVMLLELAAAAATGHTALPTAFAAAGDQAVIGAWESSSAVAPMLHFVHWLQLFAAADSQTAAVAAAAGQVLLGSDPARA